MISQNQNKYMKKLIVLFVASMMLIGFSSVSAKAYSIDDIYAQIKSLEIQIDSLKDDLSALVLSAVKTVAPSALPATLSTTKTILPTIVAPTLTPTKTETPTINKADRKAHV